MLHMPNSGFRCQVRMVILSFKKVVSGVAQTKSVSHILGDDMVSKVYWGKIPGIQGQEHIFVLLIDHFSWFNGYCTVRSLIVPNPSSNTAAFLLGIIIAIKFLFGFKEEEKMPSLSFFFLAANKCSKKSQRHRFFVCYIPAEPDNPVPSDLVFLPVLLDIFMSDGDLSSHLLTTLD